MGLDPAEGAVQLTVTTPADTVAVMAVGAPGVVSAITNGASGGDPAVAENGVASPPETDDPTNVRVDNGANGSVVATVACAVLDGAGPRGTGSDPAFELEPGVPIWTLPDPPPLDTVVPNFEPVVTMLTSAGDGLHRDD